LVLGDDIVIFDKDVGEIYQSVMLDLGVGISLPKSVISPPNTLLRCEFAAKLCVGGLKVGPLPLGAIFSGTRSDLFSIWKALKVRVPELVPALTLEREFCQNLIHGPDFAQSFPLAEGVYDELATL
jgi:hypothetical protein